MFAGMLRVCLALALSAVVPVLCMPSGAWAHALTGSVVSGAPQGPGIAPLAVAFVYSDDTPAAYVQAEIYAPGENKVEYQNGRTDQNGVLAFAPDRAGDWRVIVADTAGHRAEITIAVSPADTGKEVGESRVSAPAGLSFFEKLLRAALGVSLLCNLCLLPLLLKRRSAGKNPA